MTMQSTSKNTLNRHITLNFKYWPINMAMLFICSNANVRFSGAIKKWWEETPSPLMTPKIREEMGKHAVAAAKAVNYEGAGTIEFIMDDNLNYYFLEMNTRLQVEHPITERVVGVDLVKQQILIASGEALKLKQQELTQQGHAIECRIYAEDPDNNFMPSPGVIKHITEPLGLGVRHDGYVYEGYDNTDVL